MQQMTGHLPVNSRAADYEDRRRRARVHLHPLSAVALVLARMAARQGQEERHQTNAFEILPTP